MPNNQMPLTARFAWMMKYESGSSVAEISKQFGVSRKTFYKWLRRYKKGDQLLDWSRRPHHFPRVTPQPVIDLLVAEAKETGYGQRRLRKHMMTKYNITLSERTIWKHLKRAVSSSGQNTTLTS